MRIITKLVPLTLLATTWSLAACSGSAKDDPGALINLTMQSTVGVLLDELPGADRDRAADTLLAAPDDFWRQRALMQVETTYYRLTYRNFFVDAGQLPLPPREQWTVALSAPERRTIGSHDLVVIDYTFTGTLLAALDQPGLAEPLLDNIGGEYDELFTLPVDPDLLLERTGYACMDEEDFPPNSVDTENARSFYDDTCEAGFDGCHVTEDPGVSCIEALEANVGAIETMMHFERMPWDSTRANAVRTTELATGGPELRALREGVEDHRVVYRYFEDGSCAIAEGCISGSGWRRLLQFTATMHNIGDQDMMLGDVGPDSLAVLNNMVSRSPCHDHMHFNHYGDFTFGAGAELGSKRAFCLESTTRYSNHELAPLVHEYACDYQGTAAGWGDDYIAGLDCQWIDITPIAGPISAALTFTVNPDGFLCEGELQYDDAGDLLFESTTFVNEEGEIESRFVCEQRATATDDNTATTTVDISAEGGLVTEPCTRGQLGAKRNCGLSKLDDGVLCTAGQMTTLSCSVAAGSMAQVLRVCENSAVLGHGIPCTYREALADTTVTETQVDVSFTCPVPRDVNEPGGAYSLYAGPAFGPDPTAAITCI